MLVGMKDSNVKFLINDLAACQDKKTLSHMFSHYHILSHLPNWESQAISNSTSHHLQLLRFEPPWTEEVGHEDRRQGGGRHLVLRLPRLNIMIKMKMTMNMVVSRASMHLGKIFLSKAFDRKSTTVPWSMLRISVVFVCLF